MRVLINLKCILSFVVLVPSILSAQKIEKEFSSVSFNVEQLQELKREFGTYKIIPLVYETQILIALSYFPELKNTYIEFRLKKKETPLSSRTRLSGLLQSANKRKYLVTISQETKQYLTPILFKNLHFNGQIGVLGHELSHIADYTNKGFGKMGQIIVIEVFSKKKVDTFEYNTDLACINHGLGYQLLDWSSSVRNSLGRENWRGANNVKANTKNERYMNPKTIMQIMSNLTIYK